MTSNVTKPEIFNLIRAVRTEAAHSPAREKAYEALMRLAFEGAEAEAKAAVRFMREFAGVEIIRA